MQRVRAYYRYVLARLLYIFSLFPSCKKNRGECCFQSNSHDFSFSHKIEHMRVTGCMVKPVQLPVKNM